MGCGCNERRDIMFTHGQPGVDITLVLGLAVLIVVLAKRTTR